MTTLKDFIYLDAERLTSLYSQAFSGVVAAIVETQLSEHENANVEEGGWKSSGSKAEERVAAASSRTQSKLLHDHMYNLLEERIAPAIQDVSGIGSDSSLEELKDAFMVRVRGAAQLWDFERIKDFFDQFDTVGSALTYISSFSPEETSKAETERDSLEELLKRNQNLRKSHPTINTAEDRLAWLKQWLDPNRRAKANSYRLDPAYMQKISLLTETFYAGSIEVIVTPQHGSGDIMIRGILDRQWFRRSPELIRMLSAGGHPQEWTVVGQLSYVPLSRSQREDNAEALASSGGDSVTETIARASDQEATPEVAIEQEQESDEEFDVSISADLAIKPRPSAARDGYRALVTT